jgi:hypothetical protein
LEPVVEVDRTVVAAEFEVGWSEPAEDELAVGQKHFEMRDDGSLSVAVLSVVLGHCSVAGVPSEALPWSAVQGH